MSYVSVRRVVRSAVAGLFLVLLGGGTAALADTPSTWEDSPSQSFFSYALVLFIIPIGLFLLIVVLSVLPSLVRGNRGTPGTALAPTAGRAPAERD